MKRLLLAVFSGLFALAAFAQTGEIRGIVYDRETGTPIDFASVYLKENLKGDATDENGFYNIIKIPAGTYTLFCSFIGYDSFSMKVDIVAGRILSQNIYLNASTRNLQEVVVSAESQDKLQNTQTAKTKITLEDMKRLVTFGGEPDLLQSLTVLPGVYSSGDQGGQLYVRGGSPVMNKVLLDGMTIYQPFHSIGLFSVFDADIIRSADVYSAGFGAEYGGRISAVVDVHTREGNKTRFAGKIAANPFTSKILLEGPIKKYREGGGSTSYIVSFKNSYLNKSSQYFYPYLDKDRLPYSFQDFYGKISFVGNNGSKLDMFGFNQSDNTNFLGVTQYKWKATGFGSRFVVLPDESKIKMDGFFSYSAYTMEQAEADGLPRFSNIKSFNIGLNFDYLMGKDQFVYGTEINTFRTDYQFTNSNGRAVGQFDNNTELSFYAKFRKVTKRLVLEPGLRLQYYASFSEFFLEPRFAAKLVINSKLRFKMAAGIYSQNLISASSDRDVVNLFYGFLASPDNLPKQFQGKDVTSRLQKARHIVGGFEIDLGKNSDLLVESYFKDFYQLTNINRDKLFEANTPGQPSYLTADYVIENGYAYGFDFRYKYDNKKFYLWAVYSYTMISRYDGIRNYNPQFDRRHNANVVASYKFGKKSDWECNARWNFGSGFPFTQTASFYELIRLSQGISADYTKTNGEVGIIFSDINKGRLPYFHRLDVSVQKRIVLSKNSSLQLIASCINVYNRANIFYFDRVSYKRVDQLPILPAIGANLSF